MNEIIRLGVLADTHLTRLADAVEFAERLLDGPFAGVEAILHCGDMVLPDFATVFGELPFYAVRGNMDPPHPDLPLKRIRTFGRFRIGMVHGWGAPAAVPFHALSEFSDQNLDLLLFGHSHVPYSSRQGKTLLFNPGSAMDHRGRHPFCTLGLIELSDRIEVRHLRFDP